MNKNLREQKVPRLASLFLAAFVAREHRDYLLGDLAEEYHLHILPKRGRAMAHGWYWLQVVRSIGSQPGLRKAPGYPATSKGDGMMSLLFTDLRYALRGLLKVPGFTLVAVLTLTLGIGANTAIFSVVYSVLLAPFPYGQTETLLQIWGTNEERGWFMASLSEPNFWDFKERNQSFEYLAAYRTESVNLTGADYPERIRAGNISSEFLRTLGVSPTLGRDFLPEEDDLGRDGRVAILSNHFWRSHFGSNSDVVGETISLNSEGYTVIGVLPHDGYWLDNAQVFVPMVRDPDAVRGNNMLVMIGRLRAGVSEAAALADMESVASQLADQYPDPNEGLGVTFGSSERWRAGSDIRLALWVLMGAVGLLLLIACVNLANLLLARATGKLRETAVCAALGASRGRIVSRMLAESILISAFGALLGLVLAFWAVQLLKTLGSQAVPRVDEVSVNAWVLGFTLLTAIVTAFVSGLVPAVQAPFANVLGALRDGDRGASAGRVQSRIRASLVGTEVMLSLMLLVGAGLLVRSFGQLQRLDTGFESESRLTFAVNLPTGTSREEGAENTRLLLTEFLGRLEATPLVQSAGAVNWKPLEGSTINMGIRDVERPPDGEWEFLADWRYVTPGYFETMGLSLVRGRDFNQQDLMHPTQTPPWSIVISEALADELWPGEDPIGRRTVLWVNEDAIGTVVGVVENMRERGLDREPSRAVYLPYFGADWSPVHFVVHAAGDPISLVPTVRSTLASFDSSLPLYDIGNLDDSLQDSVAGRRLNALLLSAFSIVALILALAGVYGVMAYTVARRTVEIGVRVALGAGPTRLIKQIVASGLRPAIVGIAVGILGAFALSRYLSTLLFEIEPTDPASYIGAALLLLVAAMLACYVPARRALSASPAEALRDE